MPMHREITREKPQRPPPGRHPERFAAFYLYTYRFISRTSAKAWMAVAACPKSRIC